MNFKVKKKYLLLKGPNTLHSSQRLDPPIGKYLTATRVGVMYKYKVKVLCEVGEVVVSRYEVPLRGCDVQIALSPLCPPLNFTPAGRAPLMDG